MKITPEKMLINGFPFIEHTTTEIAEKEMIEHVCQFYELMDKRRSVRDFSSAAVPRNVIEKIILTASTAPSGAHKQPWTFCVISNEKIKKQVREAAEKEEFDSYNGRMPAEWLQDLAPLQTTWQKPFLETAPWLIVVFKQVYGISGENKKNTHYYVNESVGIACGFLLAAIHQAGLVALTHTPSPMDFLTKLLNRPQNERPFLLIPVGYAANKTFVPDIERKPLDKIAIWYE